MQLKAISAFSLKLRQFIKAEHANDAIARVGARREGGRWNSKGVRVVYTSEMKKSADSRCFLH